MKKIVKNKGFTMAEMLIVVAIVMTLSGVAFVAVQRHQRSLDQLEKNTIAKEIFIAAQNHLAMAELQGYLGVKNFGNQEAANSEKFNYLVVTGNTGNTFSSDESSLLDYMLPFGSIDETIRGGCYLLRYNRNPGTVLEVYYWSNNSNDRYAYKGETTATALKSTWESGGNNVVGWYGFTADSEIEGLETADVSFEKPTIEVENAEKLTVIVTDTNASLSSNLKLIVTGKKSGANAAFVLRSSGTTGSLTDEKRVSSSSNKYTIILDDITAADRHFYNLNDNQDADGTSQTSPGYERLGKFEAGEDIIVKAVAYSNSALSNIAYSSEVTVNSLFADVEDSDTALIGNIRHLENLGQEISNVNTNNNEGALKITSAEQIQDLGKTEALKEGEEDLSWTGFRKAITGSATDDFNIYNADSTLSTTNAFYPINTSYALDYNGKNHSICCGQG